MLFNGYVRESADDEALEDVMDTMDAESLDDAEANDAMAREVETHMLTAAMENMSLYDGGDEAYTALTESAGFDAILEARRIPKNTFVRLNKQDDLQRRQHLACLVLAKNHNDSAFKKYKFYRAKAKEQKKIIIKKYANRAKIIASKSQKVHIKNMRKLPSLPKITL